MISAILLAAGESRRMGKFKQLLQFRDKSFVEHCVDSLLASRVDEVIIVTGHRDSDVRQALGDRPERFAHNSDYMSGMSSSVKCGVRSLSQLTRAFILTLVDQPQISSNTINRVIDTFERKLPLIVVPTYEGKNGHPVLMDISLKDEILALDNQQGLSEVVRAHREATTRVEMPTSEVIEDFDLPEDYERISKE